MPAAAPGLGRVRRWPRRPGLDYQGREVLLCVAGEVGRHDRALPLPPWFRTTGARAAIGDWLRHDDPCPDQREHLVDARIHQMFRCADDLEALALTDLTFPAPVDLAVARRARRDAAWVSDNLTVLSAAVRVAPAAPTG
jgi:hypothetical protein